MFGQSWRISFLAVEGLRDVELSERDSHLFVAITMFDKVFSEFSASLVKESVGGTYAADSEEEA